jgi:hypothetical protein
MPQRFNEGDRVKLKTEKKFKNPVQTLPVGSQGTVLLKLIDGVRYQIQFDARTKFSIIKDADLQRV